jgi:hypothetical protein
LSAAAGDQDLRDFHYCFCACRPGPIKKATRLCEAASGILWTYDGGRFRAAAVHGATEEYVEWLHSLPHPVPSPSLARIASGEKIVRDDDLATAPGTVAYAHTLAGMRTGFLVALRKGDALLGAIRIFQQDPARSPVSTLRWSRISRRRR